MTHVAAVALVLPSGPTSLATHGVPWQAERTPAAPACIPLAHGRQTFLQRHWYLLLQETEEALFVLNMSVSPS
jgi:hypothetical protein